jgi:hypothetical protein
MNPCQGKGCGAKQLHPTGLCARCRAKTAEQRGERACPCCVRSLPLAAFDGDRKVCRECSGRKVKGRPRSAPERRGAWVTYRAATSDYLCGKCHRTILVGEVAWRLPDRRQGRRCVSCMDGMAQEAAA